MTAHRKKECPSCLRSKAIRWFGFGHRVCARCLRRIRGNNLSPAQAIQRPDSRLVGCRDSEAKVSGNWLPWFDSTGAVTRDGRRRRRGNF